MEQPMETLLFDLRFILEMDMRESVADWYFLQFNDYCGLNDHPYRTQIYGR